MFKNNILKKHIGIVVALILLALTIAGCSAEDEKPSIDLGEIGRVIYVRTIGDSSYMPAYVAGENKILLPTGVLGGYDLCCEYVDFHQLKGCENPRMPTTEAEDLPEALAQRLVRFFQVGDLEPYGFWTSLKAEHATIEIVGKEPKSCHYAGVIGNYFRAGPDGVATGYNGYFLKPVEDDTCLGLLVVYDVTDEFELKDKDDLPDVDFNDLIDESEFKEAIN